MGKTKEVLVAVSEDFHYDLDSVRRRTLPAGWRGWVAPKVAAALKKEGKGGKVPATDATAAEKAKADEAAPEKAAAPNDPTANPSGETGDGETSDGETGNPDEAGDGSGDQSDQPQT